MKKYWLTLHPDTFIWLKGENGIVYNAINHKQVIFYNKGIIDELIVKLLHIDNLYSVAIDETCLSDNDVRRWVDNLLATQSAMLVENDGINRRPISLKPELKVQDSMDYYILGHAKGTNASIMSNLHKLVFHINGSRYGNDIFQKQIVYPRAQAAEMKADDIQKFVISFGSTHFLTGISLVGCLWEHSECDSLLAFLDSSKITTAIYCTEKDYLDYNGEGEKLELSENVKYHILISNYEINPQSLFAIPIKKKVFYEFVVTSEQDFIRANEWMEYYQIVDNSKLHPVYTGTNLAFLEENLYMQQSDLEDICLSKREIFAHQILNTNFFGTFIILPDGKVYSGNLYSELGRIEEGLYALVYREVTEKRFWFNIRNQEPCNSCLYQWLCPPPSIYEYEIGKPNLCKLE